MNLKHRIRINVSGASGEKPQTILKGGDCFIHSNRLSRLLGGGVGVLVLVPQGKSIRSVEVQEIGNGGAALN